MNELSDGTYDAVVIDVVSDAVDQCRVYLALSSGPTKGDVVTVVARGFGRDPIDLLGLPATLIVRDGKPAIRFDH